MIIIVTLLPHWRVKVALGVFNLSLANQLRDDSSKQVKVEQIRMYKL